MAMAEMGKLPILALLVMAYTIKLAKGQPPSPEKKQKANKTPGESKEANRAASKKLCHSGDVERTEGIANRKLAQVSVFSFFGLTGVQRTSNLLVDRSLALMIAF